MAINAPELLSDIAGKISLFAHTEYGLPKDTADVFGERIADLIAEEWGGQSLYIPIGLARRRAVRNERILEEFTGDNVPQLARKYGMSIQTVYRIVKRERAGGG